MESLNLNTLVSSLPLPNNAATEKALLDDFKAAASSVTALYRSSLNASKRSYNKGYTAACQEILQMIQQSVSDHTDSGLHVGRVMDWLEARIDAIKAQEEEEDEDDDRPGPSSKVKSTTSIARPSSAPAAAANSPKEINHCQPPSSKLSHSISYRHSPPSPPSPPLRPSFTPQIPSQSVTRQTKHRPSSSATRATTNDQPSLVEARADVMTPSSQTPVSVSDPFPISAGAKRRHMVMMMLDHSTPSGESSVSPSVSMPRRRTKSTRAAPTVTVTNQNQDTIMDSEEEGRERKRTSRRR